MLFFDETDPIMQYLLHLDYFEYEHIKEIDRLSALFPRTVIFKNDLAVVRYPKNMVDAKFVDV